MAYLLLACPKCHAAYKIPKELAETELVCRSCGHRWIPAKPASADPAAAAPPAGASAAAAPSAAAPPPPHQVGALEQMAQAAPPAPKDASGKAARPFREPAGQAAPADALAAMARGGGPGSANKADDGVPVAQPLDAVSSARAVSGQTPREEKSDPLVGTSINGFKVQARIGSGGFGVVYRAFDTNLERSVALKMLPPKIAKAGQGLVERFLREARSAAKLSHPNIVTIHQICPYKDTYYIVMELVEGGALHEYLAVRKRFEPVEATRIIRAAAEGLGHAHRRGIIHRDIKPGNIMLTNDGQTKVSDFGLARDVLQGHDIVGPGHSLGTPRYMAPEMALGDEPTAASDLYSLAATYYALLTGRPPFDAATDREVMKKHVTDLVPDPRQFAPELPVAVFRFFEKAMAKQGEDRYQTAEEFVEALDRLDFGPGGAPAAMALAAQIGKVAAEDRGSHLSETLDRVVSRAQRQGTPMLDTASPLQAQPAAKGGSAWLVWVLIGFGLVILLGGAAVLAVILAGRNQPLPVPPGPTPPAAPGPVQPGKAAKSAETPATTPGTAPAPAEKPPEPGPATPPGPAPKATATEAPPATLEDAARAALEEARKFEADPKNDRYDVINMYEETVINVYPKSKSADEARAAIDRLKKSIENPQPKADKK